MSVPRLLARMTRIQKNGSEDFADWTPYIGIWQHTRKMKRVMVVHRTFSRNGILRSGLATSGRTHMTGRIRWRNLIFVRRSFDAVVVAAAAVAAEALLLRLA